MMLPVILLLIVTLLTGTEASTVKKKHHDHHEENIQVHGEESALAAASSANVDFAFNLYKIIANRSTSNILLSPLSISTALAMLSLGTRSATCEQLFKGLHFENMTQERIMQMNRGYQQLLQVLTAENSEMQLLIGNSLHIQKGFDVLQRFLNETKKFYDAEVFTLDFQQDPQNAKQQLNNYLKTVTKGKIKEMFTTIDPSTKLLLINYIFFKGKWKKPFDPALTREAFFNVNKTTKVKVQLMSQSSQLNKISDHDIFSTVIKLPYFGNASMIAILPAEGGLEYAEQNLSREKFEEWLQQLAYNKNLQRIFFPKLSLSKTYELKNILTEMGIRDLFTSNANLLGISENENLKVSKVTHEAALEIDEKATEAAAVTKVQIVPLSHQSTVRFDRPFLFLIYEENTNNILFLGRIKDPSKKHSP
ncbi:alpha-1-antitrypsin-like isoform X2 [Pristis pectinata]|uniref:alpha-1-antitrypsin-like isoform X2 n=1 Tax=Pristis pectinata TaxID=685728 RepID=UPI00223D8B30|nr:alpha-1-antitrypsin-like isoform X2 [Pristis pectinata]